MVACGASTPTSAVGPPRISASQSDEPSRGRRRLYGVVELATDVAQIGDLRLARRHPPRQIAEWGEITLLDDRRGRDLEVDIAEQRGVVLELVRVLERRERGGEPDDVGAVEPRDQGAQDDRPVVEEVMTLVQDHRADTRGGDAVDEGASVRVEIVVGRRAVSGQQVVPDPLDALPELIRIGVGVGLGHAPDAFAGSIRVLGSDHLPRQFLDPRRDGQITERVRRGVGGRDDLIGQGGDRSESSRIAAADGRRVRREHLELLEPLALDRRRRGEDHRRRGGTAR